MPETLPIVRPPKPKFELLISVLTFAVTIYTAIRVIRLQESVNNLERNHVPDKERSFEPNVNIDL